MPDRDSPFSPVSAHADWLRLETLVMTRWLAVLGQLSALLVAAWGMGLGFDLALSLGVVGISALANLASMGMFSRDKRLSDSEAMLSLMFDLTQLALLLFLTGGLTNPFALLLLAPVTIAATALQLRATVMLGALAIGLCTLLMLSWQPLILPGGAPLTLPAVYFVGIWVALVTGLVFLGLYARRVAEESRKMAEALLATQMALDRAQKLIDLGGVVAAAAHELGTPLATIKLVSSEMVRELSDQPDLRDDAELIRAQAERCSAILRGMGQSGKRDILIQTAPLEAIVSEAAAPHMERGKKIMLRADPQNDPAMPMPEVQRRPEILHGLRNLVQNAVDFAAARVWVEMSWTPQTITLRILDDGPGYPPGLISRLGEPYLGTRRDAGRDPGRPEYDGMGLGVFIAKTLLQRSGATLAFHNIDPSHDHETGAVAVVSWPSETIAGTARRAMGENPSQSPGI